ncbi:hypothetical protein J2I47_00870 [Fibrella sp. HMF5335]|uniref:Uncharacterized protein n=1 Tax=Fibrella rubiginis TaxID=2817060 RepID=A0A939GB18_9BACT|nr:hypothetical protein [Fibrella rubiginis]MBO0935086.1 hypothetical protein [Fibrella rubiginis]
MAIQISGFMSRKQLSTVYKTSPKTFTKSLVFHFKGEFTGIRLFSPDQVARIVAVLGPWDMTIED